MDKSWALISLVYSFCKTAGLALSGLTGTTEIIVWITLIIGLFYIWLSQN
jgi:hypothetical protein